MSPTQSVCKLIFTQYFTKSGTGIRSPTYSLQMRGGNEALPDKVMDVYEEKVLDTVFPRYCSSSSTVHSTRE
ncbi:hypothetical protein A2U01_0060033 [Trifolium medium]|uniref:Uncharacterized protein n=1 Tax=Trifolium medium TaxID=97028 RepID=A0A392RRT2_9FABA|nr:hypothetical protein [Trifolium medium]